MNDVFNDIKKMEQISIEHKLSKPEIWNTRFSQIGFIFHFVNADHEHENAVHLMESESSECIKNICQNAHPIQATRN